MASVEATSTNTDRTASLTNRKLFLHGLHSMDITLEHELKKLVEEARILVIKCILCENLI